MNDGELPIRVSSGDDWAAVSALLQRAFHENPDPVLEDIQRKTYEPDRALVVTDGDEIVGHAAAYSRDLAVPGAVQPAAHVTMVGVVPTHRRRGLLTRMIRRQLREVRDAGREPFAVLWASEGRIYPRFGYGQAAQRFSMEIDVREAPILREWQRPGLAARRLRAGDPARLRADMRQVYERLMPTRPGWSSRNDAWWDQVLADTEGSRNGSTTRRAVLVEDPRGPAGYATWRTRTGWNDGGPNAEVLVDELVAADAGAYTALWRFLFGIDLTRVARFSFATLDEPLLHLVAEPGRLGARARDGLWIRLVDVEAALAARRYAVPIDVVIEVDDPLLPENAGRWRVTGDPDGAACAPTTAPADLACDVRALGAAYLAGTSLGALAAAGRVAELRPGALAAAGAAFGWHRAPGSIEVF